MSGTAAMGTKPRVRDVMTKEPICADEGMGIRALARLFDENGISGAPVVDAGGKLVGVVSRTDLMRRCSEGTAEHPPGYLFELLADESAEEGGVELTAEPLIVVQDFMSGDPVTAREDELLAPVAHRMASRRVHRVVVVNGEGAPIGVVTTLDVLRVYPG
jgi:CBS domain-containing protein